MMFPPTAPKAQRRITVPSWRRSGFGAYGAVVADVAIRRDGQAQSLIRTDTYWRTDLPSSMDTLVLGDTVSSGGAWSRPVRYGGVRYARDFTLAPGYITYPTPSISGSAALPSDGGQCW